MTLGRRPGSFKAAGFFVRIRPRATVVRPGTLSSGVGGRWKSVPGRFDGGRNPANDGGMSPAKLLMTAGGILVLADAIRWLGEPVGVGSGAARWIGRLPGDRRVERPGFQFDCPLATCLLASAALTAWFCRFLRRAR